MLVQLQQKNLISFFCLWFCFPPTWPPKSLFFQYQGIDCKPRIVENSAAYHIMTSLFTFVYSLDKMFGVKMLIMKTFAINYFLHHLSELCSWPFSLISFWSQGVYNEKILHEWYVATFTSKKTHYSWIWNTNSNAKVQCIDTIRPSLQPRNVWHRPFN